VTSWHAVSAAAGYNSGMSTALAAVKRELLVRYLDTWAPAALHGSRRATYAELSSEWSIADAVRVFGEFPELLARRGLEVVAAAAVPPELDLPEGVTVRTTTGDLLPTLSRDGPLFVHLDAPRRPLTPKELAWLAGGRATELFLAHDPAAPARRAALRAAGFASVAEVELVEGAGSTQRLLFATGAAKHLAAFKEAMWAVDEYAGVRYRDPLDIEHTVLDISLNPPVGPLKRALLDRVRRGSHTVAELRDYTVAETIYQAADANRVLAVLLASGALARTPDRGRITAETVIRPG
jgi:hypothetical protein